MSENTLEELDILFKKIISEMPSKCKEEYCKSLVFRTKEDIMLYEQELLRLKKLLIATESELKKIGALY